MSKKPRVLVAEDHPDVREALLSILAKSVEVAGVAERGDQVVAMAVALQPDLVLLDVSLPVQSGLQILPALRMALPEALIVVLTTHTLPIYREEALARGADVFLNKGRAVTELPSLLQTSAGARLRMVQA
jgi:two-component system, NarL family, nitrate/nitrite response regulator NarL